MAQQQTGGGANAQSAEIKALREQVDKLSDKLSDSQHEVTLLRTELAGHDKRLSDTVGRIGDVNIWLAEFAILITLLVAAAGFAGIVQAGRKATKEARDWISKNSQALRDKIDAMEAETESLLSRMGQAAQTADSHVGRIETLLNGTIDKTKAYTESEKAEIRKAEHEVKDKPESRYTVQDWNIRARAAYEAKNYAEAALYWGKLAEHPGASPGQIAAALNNKAVSMEALGRLEDAIALYDGVVQRFGGATQSAVREHVATALGNKGVALGRMGQREKAIAVFDEVIERFGTASGAALREEVASALLNKGITLVDLGRVAEAIAVYDEVERLLRAETAAAARRMYAMVLSSRAWAKYLSAEDAAFLADSDAALARGYKNTIALCNHALALYLNGRPRDEVLAAYEQAWRETENAEEWERYALNDLRQHGHSVRPEAQPVPADLIEAVAALAAKKG